MAKLVLGTNKSLGVAAMVRNTGGGGGGGGGDKYPLFTRVKADNNNEIGTVVCYQYDSQQHKFAVVVLDEIYRKIPDYPALTSILLYPLTNTYTSPEFYGVNGMTATEGTNEIYARIQWMQEQTGNQIMCEYADFARSQTFTIGGIQYAGQVPNVLEMLQVFGNYNTINTMCTNKAANRQIAFSYGAQYFTSTPTAGLSSITNYQGSQYMFGNMSVTVNPYQYNFFPYPNQRPQATYMPLLIPILELPNE